MKQTAVFSFDGVISSYKRGWEGDDVIKDKPVKGIREALLKIGETYNIVILTSRCATIRGRDAVIEWLDKYDIPYDEVTNIKPRAVIYIDSKTLTFNGNAENLLKKIKDFKSWTDKFVSNEEIVIMPGDIVKFKMFGKTYEGCVLCEYMMTNHEDSDYDGMYFYRILKDSRIYDIPRDDIMI